MSDEAAMSAPQVVHRWVGIVGLFVAPTTVITSVCYFFGFISTRKYFSYFGIDSNAIGFTTSDYVLKSVSVLYAPILVLLVAWAAMLWAGEYLRRLAKSGQHTRLIRVVGWAAIAVGALGALRGVVGVLLPKLQVIHSLALTPLALGLGTVSMVAGVWLLSTLRTRSAPSSFATAERASLFVAGAVIIMALFWITDMFATAYGENQAQSAAAKLWSKETGVTLDSAERLDPPANLIAETSLTSPAGASEQVVSSPDTTFRYQCFRALVVRGDRWVLVPARWTPEYGYALMIDADSSNRISVLRLKGIADTGAVDWAGEWQCPEVAPPTAWGPANSGSDHS